MRLSTLLLLCLLLCLPQSVPAHDLGAAWQEVQPVLERLHSLTSKQASLNGTLAHSLAEQVSKLPQGSIELPSMKGMDGAGLCFDIDADLKDVLRYGFNPELPSSTIRPNSVRWAGWESRSFSRPAQSEPLWRSIETADEPVIVQGVEHEETSPDLSTSSYYGYDLQRSLILLPDKDRPVFISLAVQAGESELGRKGEVIGPDGDWSYFYSGETGLNVFGLGWVDSRLERAFSVAVYRQIETGTVRCTCFNWLRGGWKGLNVIKSNHILKGLKRFARGSSRVLESPRLPPATELAGWRRELRQLPASSLNDRYSSHLKRLLEKPCDSSLLEDFAPAIRSGKHARRMPRPAKETELFIQRLRSTLAEPVQAEASR